MEFKIYNPQEEGFLKEIDWNYEELKTENAYLHSPEAVDAFKSYMNHAKYNLDQVIDLAHTRDYARKGAVTLGNKFEKKLTEYIYS